MNAGRLDAAAVLAILLAAGGAAALFFLLRPAAESPAAGPLDNAACVACHADVAAEWSASHHAIAFVNPAVRELSNDFANQECVACHAPRPVLEFEPGARVLARQSDRQSGVNCLSCHQGADGRVVTANPRPNAAAPCRPRHEPRLGGVEHCASCHDQHGTVQQWRDAPEPLRRGGCVDCHMVEAFRSGGRRGRHHGFPAGHDLAALQSAVALRGGWPDGGPWVEVENVGAGHHFPTDERSRAADVQVRWRLADGGWTGWERLHRFRDPYRDETELVNTQLPSGRTWRGTPQPPPGAAAGEARLVYRTNPFQEDEQAREVARVPLQP